MIAQLQQDQADQKIRSAALSATSDELATKVTALGDIMKPRTFLSGTRVVPFTGTSDPLVDRQASVLPGPLTRRELSPSAAR